MKHNALIFIIFLFLGMVKTVYAQQSGVAQNQIQQTIEQINKQSNDEYKKFYKDVDEEIDKKIKNRFEPIAQIVDAFEWLIGIITTILLGGIAYNVWKSGSIRSEMKKEITTAQDIMKKTFETQLKDGKEIIEDLIHLEQAKHQLLSVVEDIEAPSIRHEISKQAEKQIKRFLDEIRNLQELLHKSPISKISDIGDTPYNNEIAAKAYHYLGNPDHPENYDKAIDHFKGLLEKNETFDKDKIYLFLGNSYAGKGDYIEALKQYDQVICVTSDVHISKGNAYKAMVRFEEANNEFEHAKEKRKIQKDGIYWEALYQKANTLVDKGDYDCAEHLYCTLIDAIVNEEKILVEPLWLYVSLGDLYRKKENYEESRKNYAKALDESVKNNSVRIGEIYYKIGRLYFSMEEYREACNEFRKIHHNGTHYDVDNSNILLIFWGYSLIKSGEEIEGKNKINAAIKALKNEASEKEREFEHKPTQYKNDYKYLICYSYYHLAIGLSMQDDGAKNSIVYLKKLIFEHKFNFIKTWAKASDYSDFLRVKEDSEFLKIVKE